MRSRPERLTARERVEFRAARMLNALPPRAQVRLSGKPPVRLDDQTLLPEVQLTLSLLERRGDPPIETLPPPDARELTRRQAAVFSGAPIAVGAVRDLEVDGAVGPLRARHYAPLPEPGGPAPLLVFLHGGGFVIGDLDTHDTPCRVLCRHAGVHVLAIDYRLAPEHPFPAAADDAYAALQWAAEHAASLGADPERLAVGGDSAGGNLATVAAAQAVREGGRVPNLQLLFYPVTDAVGSYRSTDLFAEGFFLTRKQMEWFSEQYVGATDAADDDPRLSPLHAEALSGLPPAYVVTAAFDPLRDEGEAYADALREAGVPVALRRVPGQIHGFINAVGVSRDSRDALIEVAGAVRAILGVAATQTGPAETATPAADAPEPAAATAR